MIYTSKPGRKRNDAQRDVKLYGKASAAEYLGLSEVYVEQLVRQGILRVWQEVPPVPVDPADPDGKKTRGTAYVFQEHWLDEYAARPKPKPGPKPDPESVRSIRKARRQKREAEANGKGNGNETA